MSYAEKNDDILGAAGLKTNKFLIPDSGPMLDGYSLRDAPKSCISLESIDVLHGADHTTSRLSPAADFYRRLPLLHLQ